MNNVKEMNVPWIENIPQDWKILYIKNLIKKNRKEYNTDKNCNVLSLTTNGVKEKKDLSFGLNPETYIGQKLVYKDDYLICLRDLDGPLLCGPSLYDGCISKLYFVLNFNSRISNKYFDFLIRTMDYIGVIRKFSFGMRYAYNISQFGLLQVPVPNKKTQDKIVSVLADKCSKIDTLIVNEQKQIETIKAYEQSLITKSVLTGLSKSNMMKNSGIDWIGDIPCNWKIVHLSSLFYQLKNKNKGMACNNLLSLSYGNVVRRDINKNDGLLPEDFEGYNIINEGDIVLRLTDLQNDHKSLRTGYCTEKGIITSAYITLRKKQNINTHFVRYYLHAFDIQKGFYGLGDGVRQGLTFDGIKTLPILLPPLEEQNAIENFLNVKCSEIKKLILLKEQTIERLKDYRKSLIFEYVTGKKEVL